jgi:hypothetical protein
MLELEGDVDWPFPKRAVITMKCLEGFKVWCSPMSHLLSAIAWGYEKKVLDEGEVYLQAEYQEGSIMTGDEGSLKGLYV